MPANLTSQDNLLLQSYYTVSLLAELCNNNFLESDFFSKMSFGNPEIKRALKDEIKIDNQGCAMMALYSMLVLPREIVQKSYESEYEVIRQFLEIHATNTRTTYKKDKAKICFIGHFRNAVAHAKVEFRPNDVVVFSDSRTYKDKKTNKEVTESFSTELPLLRLGEFINQLQQVHFAYVKNLQSQKS